MPNNTNPIDHLILSGGGFLGFSYTGIFKYLEEHDLRKGIKTITGCSMGAIFGLLFCLGYSSEELTVLIKNIIFKNYLKIDGNSIINFFKLKGLENGQKMNELLQLWIKNKIDNENFNEFS